MTGGVGRYRRWGAAGAVVIVAGAMMLIWVVRLLSSSTYSPVSTVDEMISRQTDIPTPEITSGVTVTQTFVASDDDLTEVQVFLGTYMRANTVPIVFTLSEQDGRVVRTAQADPATIEDNAYHPFIFDPIPDSRGRTYWATISSPTARSKNAFAAWLGNCDCYSNGVLSINGRPSPDQELAMRVDYQHSGVVVWKELVNRMSQYKPGILKGAGIVLLGVVSTALALAGLGAATLSVFPRGEAQQWRPIWIAMSVVVAVVVVLLTGAYEGIWGS